MISASRNRIFLKSKIHTLLFYLCTKFKMMILIEPVKNPIFILFRLHTLMWKSCYNLINYFSWSSLHCIAVLGRCIILYSNALPFHGFKSLLKRMKCTLVERNLECKTVAFFWIIHTKICSTIFNNQFLTVVFQEIWKNFFNLHSFLRLHSIWNIFFFLSLQVQCRLFRNWRIL